MSDVGKETVKPGTKRNYPSTSDESDISFSEVQDGKSTKQESKRQNVTEVQHHGMDIQGAIENINKRLECLDQLARREDISGVKENILGVRSELKTLKTTFLEKIQSLESRLFEMEAEREASIREIKAVKKNNDSLQNVVRQQENRIKQCEREQNDLQQYSRRWNLRVFRVPEQEKETEEDCIAKVCRIFSDSVGVPAKPEDIEVAHRAGQRSSTKPRPILVRFVNRRKRDQVLFNRRKLKGKGISLSEDLTPANYKLLTTAMKHSLTLSAWSWNGKIYAKIKNGQKVNLNIHTNVDEAFRRALKAVEVSENEEDQ